MFNTLSNNSIFLLFAKAFPKILQSLRLRHHLPIASVLLPADRILQSLRRSVPDLAVRQIDVIKGLFEGFEGALADGGGPKAALPNDYRMPAEAGEGLIVTVVTLAVALYLRAPEVYVGLGEAEVAASRAWCQPNGWPPCSYAAAEGTSYPYSANLVKFTRTV